MLELGLIIVCCLTLASVVIGLQARRDQHSDARVNVKRIVTWWIIFAVCLAVLYGGQWCVLLFLACLYAFSLHELFSTLFSVSTHQKYVTLAVALAILIPLFMLPAAVTYALAALLFVASLILPSRLPYYPALVAIYFGVALLSLFFVYQKSLASGADANTLFLALLFITAINDIAQYVSGRLWGARPLAPTISPGKTREGALGGIFFTTLVSSALLPYTLSTDWLSAALIGLIIAITGIVGDLYISRLKRLTGVKDAGRILPGHGGLLDRIDSLLPIAPVVGAALIVIH